MKNVVEQPRILQVSSKAQELINEELIEMGFGKISFQPNDFVLMSNEGLNLSMWNFLDFMLKTCLSRMGVG